MAQKKLAATSEVADYDRIIHMTQHTLSYDQLDKAELKLLKNVWNVETKV